MPEDEIARARVWIANVNPGSVSTDFADSLAALVLADHVNGWHMFQGKLEGRSGSNVSKSRNELVTRFLDKTDGDWLLFIDSDMVFPVDTIVRLLHSAEMAGTKIIGGLCVMVTADGPIPTLYQPADSSTDVTRVLLQAPQDQILQVFATGAACLMVHRDVLEAVREASPADRNFCWFQEKVINTRWVSEDITFCLQAYKLGYSVFVDTTLSIGHVKNGRIWRASDIGSGFGVEPAKTVAVIPTKGAVDEHGGVYVLDLVDQLRTQGSVAEIVVVDNGMGFEPETDDVTVLDGEGMGIHEMWNLGAMYAVEKYGHRTRVAILNDDLRVGDRFVQRMAEALDSGSPLLVAVSGNYDGRTGEGLVEEVTDICAGRYDGTGGLAGFAFMCRGDWFTSGYRFPEACKWWYGDNDLVRAIAANNHKAGIALKATVEHLDGGGKTAGDWFDEKYAAQLEADRVAFEARWAKFRSQAQVTDAEWDPHALAAGTPA